MRVFGGGGGLGLGGTDIPEGTLIGRPTGGVVAALDPEDVCSLINVPYQGLGSFPLDTVTHKGIVYARGVSAGAGSFLNPYPSYVNVTVSTNFNADSTRANMTGRTTASFMSSTNGSDEQWVKLDLLGAYHLTHAEVCQGDDSWRYFSNVKFEGSNDDSAWTDLGTATGCNTGVNTWTAFAFTSAGNYRYVRVTMSGLSTRGDRYFQLGEVELYGSPAT